MRRKGATLSACRWGLAWHVTHLLQSPGEGDPGIKWAETPLARGKEGAAALPGQLPSAPQFPQVPHCAARPPTPPHPGREGPFSSLPEQELVRGRRMRPPHPLRAPAGPKTASTPGPSAVRSARTHLEELGCGGHGHREGSEAPQRPATTSPPLPPIVSRRPGSSSSSRRGAASARRKWACAGRPGRGGAGSCAPRRPLSAPAPPRGCGCSWRRRAPPQVPAGVWRPGGTPAGLGARRSSAGRCGRAGGRCVSPRPVGSVWSRFKGEREKSSRVSGRSRRCFQSGRDRETNNSLMSHKSLRSSEQPRPLDICEPGFENV